MFQWATVQILLCFWATSKLDEYEIKIRGERSCVVSIASSASTECFTETLAESMDLVRLIQQATILWQTSVNILTSASNCRNVGGRLGCDDDSDVDQERIQQDRVKFH